jgi:hypothetical protein
MIISGLPTSFQVAREPARTSAPARSAATAGASRAQQELLAARELHDARAVRARAAGVRRTRARDRLPRRDQGEGERGGTAGEKVVRRFRARTVAAGGPDLFAKGQPTVGPPGIGVWAPPADPQPGGPQSNTSASSPRCGTSRS